MRLLIGALAVAAALGCGREIATGAREKTTSAPPSQANALEELPSPAGAGAAEPFLFAARNGVLLSWLEPIAGTDRVALRFARYTGGAWSTPRTIVERNDLFVNWADFPALVEDANGTLFAHWLQKSSAGTYSYDVRMSTSIDGGTTWREPFLLNRDGTKTEHGFASLAPLPGGGVGATWLDGRNMKEGGAGAMTLRYATVDASGTIAADVELDARVCECCTTGMTMTASGPVIVYRDRSGEEIRDISYVAKTANGWSEPRPLHADGWKIAGCPVNGPQIDAIGDRAAAAWFTAPREKGRALVAFSGDGGATFAKPVPIDDGKPVGRVDVVMLNRETALVTWLEQTAAGAEIRARRVSRERGAEPSITIAASSTARAAGFARIARAGAEVYFAWTEVVGQSKQSANSKRVHIARGQF